MYQQNSKYSKWLKKIYVVALASRDHKKNETKTFSNKHATTFWYGWIKPLDGYIMLPMSGCILSLNSHTDFSLGEPE